MTGRLEDEVEAIAGRGGIFKGGIHDDQAVRIAFIDDPDGNELYLSELQK
jgi:predicted enzyme related to lactoylglutathione lyase